MKRTINLAGFAILLVMLLSFSATNKSTIKGKVTPAAYASSVWAISKTDTLYTTVNHGIFEFSNVQPGMYRLIIGAESPYRATAKDNIVVANNEITDVGDISLSKYVVVFN